MLRSKPLPSGTRPVLPTLDKDALLALHTSLASEVQTSKEIAISLSNQHDMFRAELEADNANEKAHQLLALTSALALLGITPDPLDASPSLSNAA